MTVWRSRLVDMLQTVPLGFDSRSRNPEINISPDYITVVRVECHAVGQSSHAHVLAQYSIEEAQVCMCFAKETHFWRRELWSMKVVARMVVFSRGGACSQGDGLLGKAET